MVSVGRRGLGGGGGGTRAERIGEVGGGEGPRRAHARQTQKPEALQRTAAARRDRIRKAPSTSGNAGSPKRANRRDCARRKSEEAGRRAARDSEEDGATGTRKSVRRGGEARNGGRVRRGSSSLDIHLSRVFGDPCPVSLQLELLRAWYPASCDFTSETRL